MKQMWYSNIMVCGDKIIIGYVFQLPRTHSNSYINYYSLTPVASDIPDTHELWIIAPWKVGHGEVLKRTCIYLVFAFLVNLLLFDLLLLLLLWRFWCHYFLEENICCEVIIRRHCYLIWLAYLYISRKRRREEAYLYVKKELKSIAMCWLRSG
jgi:hypothetical protein